MQYCVLGIGYLQQEHETAWSEWIAHGITFDLADSILQAAEKLRQRDYICVAIRSGHITHEELSLLREARDLPVIMLPPSYTAAERYVCAHISALQYIHASGKDNAAELGDGDSVRHYLDIPTGERKPLTFITVKDLSFCLEHRSVEIKGQKIELTEKEFDILALLIMNQRQVFTYDMIMDAIWQEDFSFYSRNALSTHISNLRRKLKVTPDTTDHIKSIRGVGYKFEVRV